MTKKDETKRTSQQRRAGLTLPVSRIGKIVRSNVGQRDHVSKEAMVAVTAATEYFVQELLELSGNRAVDKKTINIKPTMIHDAIVNDPMLEGVFEKYMIVGGGYRPVKKSF